MADILNIKFFQQKNYFFAKMIFIELIQFLFRGSFDAAQQRIENPLSTLTVLPIAEITF